MVLFSPLDVSIIKKSGSRILGVSELMMNEALACQRASEPGNLINSTKMTSAPLLGVVIGLGIVIVVLNRELSYPSSMRLPYKDFSTDPLTDELTWQLQKMDEEHGRHCKS